MRLRRLALYALALAALLAPSLRADGPANPLADKPTNPLAEGPASRPSTDQLAAALVEDEPAYTQADADKLVREILPLVEQAAGKKFLRTPRVKVCRRAEMVKSLRADLTPQMRLVAGLIGDKKARAAMAANLAEAMGAAMLGKYGVQDKVLYLPAGNVRPLLKLMKVDPKLTRPLLKLIVAHELTHALQDQHIDLTKSIVRPDTVDSLQAFNACIEGHAVLIQDLVGEKLHLTKAVREFSRLLAAGCIESDDPVANMQNRMMAEQFKATYIGGRAFMGWHYERGGTKKVWQILAAPPSATATGQKVLTQAVRVVRGSILVEVMLAGRSLSQEGFRTLVNKVFARVAAVRKAAGVDDAKKPTTRPVRNPLAD